MTAMCCIRTGANPFGDDMKIRLSLFMALLAAFIAGCAESTEDGPSSNVEPSIELTIAETQSADETGSSIRIAVVRIELKSIEQAERRMNRIGAHWEFVPPNLPLEELKEFDVVCFPSGWGELDGLAGLRQTYHDYVAEGGGLLFACPDANGDAEENPALTLLPYPLSVYDHGDSGQSVAFYAPGKPHPLLHEIQKTDLPFPYDTFLELDDRWTVIAQSSGSKKSPTVLTASVGEGRAVVHASLDDSGHLHHLSDRFMVRVMRWLASEPPEAVAEWSDRLGQRQYLEFVAELDADYRRLIANEPESIQSALRNADSILRNEAQESSTWTDYNKALHLLNRHRSKATIPLVLKLLLDENVNHHPWGDDLLQTLTLLTGEKMTSEDVEVITKDWWHTRKDQIDVDLDRLPDAHIQTIANELLAVVSHVEPMGLGRSEKMDGGTMYAILDCGYRVYADKYRAVLHPRLLPHLLEACQRRDRRWLTLGPLAAMFMTKVSPELSGHVADNSQSMSTRVMVASALQRAKATAPPKTVLSLVAAVQETDLRQAVILMLGRHTDDTSCRTGVGALVDEEKGVREAAQEVVQRNHSAVYAVPLSELVIAEWKAGHDVLPILTTMRRNSHEEMTRVQIELVRHFLSNDPEGKVLEQVLEVLSYRTSNPFGEDADLAQHKAIAALKWWDEQQ